MRFVLNTNLICRYLEPHLGKIQQRVLCLASEQDWLIPSAEEGNRLKRKLPRCRLKVISHKYNCGAWIMCKGHFYKLILSTLEKTTFQLEMVSQHRCHSCTCPSSCNAAHLYLVLGHIKRRMVLLWVLTSMIIVILKCPRCLSYFGLMQEELICRLIR